MQPDLRSMTTESLKIRFNSELKWQCHLISRLAAGQELGAQLLTEGEEGVSSPAGGSSSVLF